MTPQLPTPRKRPLRTSRPLTVAELAKIQAVLEAEAARLRQDIAAASRQYGSEVGEFFNGAGDEIVDLGSLMVELREGSTLASNEIDILDQCERALERIRTNCYGVCEGCETPIDKARLKALPRATHCLECQQARVFS